jgi:polyisoprenoid-binding protein YceI
MTAANAPLLLFLAIPTVALGEPRTYRIDATESDLVALTRPAGLLGGLAHPHVVVARHLSGKVVHDADAPERATVEATAPVAELAIDEDASRARYHLEKKVSPEDRRSMTETMRSPRQLDAERFPAITFAGRVVSRLEPGELQVRGTLTIHGVAAEVSVPVQVKVEGDRLVGTGSLQVNHAMFGMKPISLALGTIRNAEEIMLRLTLVARLEPAAAPATPP